MIQSYRGKDTKRLAEGKRTKLPPEILVRTDLKLFDLDRKPMTPEDQAIRSNTPGRYLMHFIEEYGISQAELSRRTGIQASTINEIAKDKRRINAEVAIALGAVFGNSPESWIRLHGTYELRVARLGKAAEIRARVKPLPAA